MNGKELITKFSLERKLLIDTLKGRLLKLTKLSKRYRKEDKLNIIFGEIENTKYIMNFIAHLHYGNFNRDFLNTMFFSINSNINYRKFSREITKYINEMKYRYIEK